MESLTAFSMPRMEESASCRSLQPSQPLLYFSSSCKENQAVTNGRSGLDAGRRMEDVEGVEGVEDARLQQQLVLGDPLDRFQEVGVQAKLVLQLLLALLQNQRRRRQSAVKERLGCQRLGVNLEESAV